MGRLRYNGLATGAAGSTVGLSLGASLTPGATSVTFNAALTHSNGTAVPTIVSPDYIPLEILDANGRVSEIVWLTAYTAAATTGTISRGQEGTSGVAHSSGDKITGGCTTWDVGGIIGYNDYNPGTLVSYTTSSTSLADVDATNMAVSFVAPPSGKVLVRLTGLGGQTGTGTDNYSWGLREGSSTVLPAVQVGSQSATNTSSSIAGIISGLTPGTAHTYKWAWLSSNGAATDRLYAGGVAGSAAMEVHALP